MLVFLPLFIRLPLALLLVSLNVLLHATVLFVMAALKALLPIAGIRRVLSRALVAIAEQWIAVNGMLFALFTPTQWQIEGLDGLRSGGWYLVLSNHQSWVDIPVLQKTFNRRIPFLRFFLKKQLIWVPVLGLAWWALDFPFMQRHSKEILALHPELRSQDKDATRKACERFRESPVSVMNFVEGTRFRPHKHEQQQSPYAHLLRPRAGGVAFVLEAMGEMLQAIVDVTIVYSDGRPTMIDLLTGRVRQIRVQVRQLPIPPEFLRGDYENDAEFRARFQAWISALWTEKDESITRMQAG
jgi:1-acyl-sn-glycerol-3-phosphate acyltransferase